MDCHDVTECVNLLIDGEIEEEEKNLLLQHLEKCGECRDVADANVRLKKLICEKFQRKAAYESLQKAVLKYVESKG